ncbi:MAG: aromatic amino acid transport family protein [archaeon]
MKHSYKVGFTFGLTSGIITTLGLIVGLNASTHSRLVVLGGILTIAIADSLSDALGIHISEESENKHSNKEVWESTISTFLSKLLFALTFIVPFLIFSLGTAVIVSIIWGVILLSILSYSIAKEQKKKQWKVIGEHLLIATIVIILTQVVGNLISIYF